MQKHFKSSVQISESSLEAATAISTELFKPEQLAVSGGSFGFYRSENAKTFIRTLLDNAIPADAISTDDANGQKMIDKAQMKLALDKGASGDSSDEVNAGDGTIDVKATPAGEAPAEAPKQEGTKPKARVKVRDLKLDQSFKYPSSSAGWIVTGVDPLVIQKVGGRSWTVKLEKELNAEVILLS